MGRIFGNKQSLEPQWKKVYKPRVPKRGTSELLRKVDVALKSKDYARAAATNPKAQAKAFAETVAEVKKQQAKFKDWTPQEKDFLQHLITDLETEAKFWQTYRPTPPAKPNQAAPSAKAEPPRLPSKEKDDQIVRTGDRMQITFGGQVVIPDLQAPVQLVGTGGRASVGGYVVCVLGDELPKRLTVPLPYVAPPFTTPGAGLLKLTLKPENLSSSRAVGGKPMLMAGSPFEAIFTVVTPATMPGPNGPTPDPQMMKRGTGRFLRK